MQSYFFIRTDSQCVKVNFDDIAVIEANRNYVRIVTEKKVHLVLLSLKQLERILPEKTFCRVHRSFIVSLDRVTCFDQEIVSLQYGSNRMAVPIGQLYRKYLHQKIMLVASEVRQGGKIREMMNAV